MATPEELKKAADDKAAADAAAAAKANEASEPEVRAALAKGSMVRVQMPDGVSSLSLAGLPMEVDEDGIVLIHVKHALHLVESFGGRILSEAKKALKPPVK